MYRRSSAYTCHAGVFGGTTNQVIHHRGLRSSAEGRMYEVQSFETASTFCVTLR